MALGLVLAAAACSSGPPSPAGGGSAAVVGVTGAPLKLMSVYESTGPSASPEVPEGAIAAAKAINARGGIKGRPVEIIPCDTHADPNTAAACGRTAVSQGVLAMVGDLTIYGNEFMPLLAQHKIASIGLEPATAADFTSPASFPIAGGAPVVWAGMGEALAEAGAKKIALARQNIAPAAALGQFVNNGLRRFGITVANDVPVPPGAPDMSPYVAAALKGGTDGIIVGQAEQDAVNFVLALRQADPGIKIALSATQLGDVLKALRGNSEGIIEVASDTIALKNPAEKQYEKDMKAAGYTNLTGFRLASYASVMVFGKVAARLPRMTAAGVFDALGQSRDLNVGLTPPLQFTTGGVAGLPRVFNPCLLATRISDGVAVPLTGKFQNAFTGNQCPAPS
jgi:ABC-type branched-subunit amino acid transport system substrate-binding protein